MLVARIWKSQPGDYFCLSSKSGTGKWQDHFFRRSQFATLRAFINGNMDKDLYWCPHGFSKPQRLKANAVLPTLLWADLDEADPHTMIPKPTIAYASSPSRYVGLWLTNDTITEDLNRRLTYHVHADHGGWDLTQVLRVPGTRNYKYLSVPRVTMLWADGPMYSCEEIARVLPKEVTRSDTDIMDIYHTYEERLTPFVRRELINGKPVVGKRSEVLWRLNKELLEAGMSRQEVITLLEASPWNKFKGRPDQLEREIDKATRQKFTRNGNKPEASAYTFLSRAMHEVREEKMQWLWYPYLALGELTILEGDPGIGKSYLAQMVAKAQVDGLTLPSPRSQSTLTAAPVAYFDIENTASTVTKQRLLDNGCKNLQLYYQEEEPFTIEDDPIMERVYEALERRRPKLVVFDTINTYIGRADTHKSSEVQQAFKRFREIAQRFSCAVLVLRHLTKSTKERALYRGQGSIAFTALARVVVTVGLHPTEEDVRVMAVTKLNVTRVPKALTFTIDSLPDTLKRSDRSRFVWGTYVDLTSDDITGVVKHEPSNAENVLRELLAGGAMSTADAARAAEARGISRRSLFRAADTLEVIRSTEGFGSSKVTFWNLAS